MKRSRMLIFALLLMSATGSIAQVNDNVIHKSREEAELQTKFVSTLLQSSSAAKKVKASNDANVKTLYRAANELFQNAQVYMQDDDVDAAAESLYQATVMMFQTAKLAERKKVIDDSEQRIFEARLKSVNALITAMQRIGEEKHISEKIEPIRGKAEQEIKNAMALMDSGQASNARKKIDKVYVDVKSAISELRSGDTLVRALHFETRKDEYLYELDRNETHLMLVTLLLEEKMQDPQVKAQAQVFLQQAESVKKQAEAAAKKGDYDNAVKHYEESTRLILKAIRNSGFYIPG